MRNIVQINETWNSVFRWLQAHPNQTFVIKFGGISYYTILRELRVIQEYYKEEKFFTELQDRVSQQYELILNELHMLYTPPPVEDLIAKAVRLALEAHK